MLLRRVFTHWFHTHSVSWAFLYQIQHGGWQPSWKILNGRISAKGHAIHFMLGFYGRVFRAPILYSTHRAVVFAVAQLSCLSLGLPWAYRYYTNTE